MVETNRSMSSSSSSRRRRRRSRASEFFHCFSLRSSSSSSMKISSSKSILSPGRNREQQPSISLSSSLSRRLRSNGSMKGGGQASPMFPSGSKKKGSSFETAEPSSPKVTCIGQVRVKSKKKKHGRKLRNRSLRKGEVSFRKNEQAQDGIHHSQQQECLPHRNQRWVHLPLSICETLRGFGSEFNCFTPCGGGGRRSSSSSSCLCTSEKRRGRGRSSSCGAVFARWLFAMEESEEKGKDREIESVCREEEKKEVIREIEMAIAEEKVEIEEEVKEEVEEGRESICVPPKNALLLMRSRSAPFRMSSLANRFWESPATQHNGSQETREEEEEEEEEEEGIEIEGNVNGEKLVLVEEKEEKNEDSEVKLELEEETKEVEMLEEEGKEEEMRQKEDILMNESSQESLKEEEEKVEEMKEFEEKKEERRVSFSSSTTIYLEPEPQEEEEEEEEEEEAVLEEAVLEERVEKSTEEEEINGQDEEKESSSETETSSLLPECLLLMMCEPKLSMEVSKETWVCSTDFIRYRQPEKKVIKSNGGDESMKKQNNKQLQKQNKQKQNKQFQAARSSFSKVEPAIIEQKLVKAGAYEPLVLKRCKSEPNRNSAKLAPEVCFWKKNKLDQPEIGC